MLSLFEISTTAQEIHDGVVAMGETLVSCCLCGEILARRHGAALAVTSNTRCTQGY
jgi:ribosomal protein S27E